MKRHHHLIFTDDGRVETLYDDALDLPALGTLTVERASHVEYDNAQGGWVVTWPDGASLPTIFPTRQAALTAEEVALLQRRFGIEVGHV